jgi:hypothetical protein
MITVTEEEVERWNSTPDTGMKWDEYPWSVGEERIPVTVAFGAGLNSTAMLIGCVFKGQPLDLILFADTGNERPETYLHCEQVSDWLEKHGYPGVEVVSRDGEYESLGDRCKGEDMGPSLAYGFRRKACSQKWKVAPQKKRINNWEPAQQTWDRGEYIIKLIGYDVGETHRYQEAYDDNNGYMYEYPLVDWKWDRRDCERVIMFADKICLPPKSSCYFCPSMKPDEILQLRRRHPELYEDAIEVEKSMQSTLQEDSSIEGLSGRFSWQKIVEAKDKQPELLERARSRDIDCSCYDGNRSRDEDMNEHLAEKVDPQEKDLPFPFEQAGKFDEMRKAERAGGEGTGASPAEEETPDVTREQLLMSIPDNPSDQSQTDRREEEETAAKENRDQVVKDEEEQAVGSKGQENERGPLKPNESPFSFEGISVEWVEGESPSDKRVS